MEAQEHDPGSDILYKVEAVTRQFRALRVKSYLATTGANVLDQCLAAGLIDEILMHIVPELIGDGVRLFDESTRRASLETLDVSTTGQIVNLRLRVEEAS